MGDREVKPYHRTLVFWLGSITTAYGTGIAAFIGLYRPSDQVMAWLAGVAAVLAFLTTLAKRREAPRTPPVDDLDGGKS